MSFALILVVRLFDGSDYSIALETGLTAEACDRAAYEFQLTEMPPRSALFCDVEGVSE